jgi:hypothetical protein
MECTRENRENHYRDLPDQIVDHVPSCEIYHDNIKTLLYWGFTVENLVQDFNFDETEVKDCLEDMDDFDLIH